VSWKKSLRILGREVSGVEAGVAIKSDESSRNEIAPGSAAGRVLTPCLKQARNEERYQLILPNPTFRCNYYTAHATLAAPFLFRTILD